jgi:hypothetical protein
MDTTQQLYITAALASLMMQLLNLLETRGLPAARRPDFRSFIYWIPYFVLPILALFLIYILDGEVISRRIAAGIGISAPAIFRSLAQTASTALRL